MSSDNVNQSGFEEWDSIGSNSVNNMPSFTNMLSQKLCGKIQPPQGFDPHAMMVKKHKIETGEVPVDTTNKTNYPEEDIKELEDFCKKFNIIGFNFGTMPPKLALARLKAMVGYDDRPLEDRIPMGYERGGTPPQTINSSFPYQKAFDKRTLLNG